MDLTKITKALSEPTRYHILKTIIAKGEMCCGAVEKCFDLSQPTISHHIKILAEANLIIATKCGQHSHLKANQKELDKYLEVLNKELSN